eukprot:gene6192-6907_t
MTWITSFYLRAFTILLQVALIVSDELGRGKPVIRQHPNDVNDVADNVTIPCLADGSKPLKITWLKNGHALNVDKLSYLQLLPDGPLTITGAQKGRDQGEYQCIVSNSVGTVISKKAKITFPSDMDSFSMPDTEVTVNQGDRVLLKCHAPNSFPDRLIYWSKRDKRNPNQPIIMQSSEDAHYSSNAEGDLYFAYTKSTDHGEFYCNVENDNLGRYQRRTVDLVVNSVVTGKNVNPRIWYVTTKKAVAGEKYDLECIAYGRPVPTIRIYKVNSDVTLGSRDGNKRVVRFSRFQISDSGLYVCEASNVFGLKDTKTFYISVDARPSWVYQPQDMLADIGQPQTFPCVATGIPRVVYNWYYNGQKLPIGKEYTMAGGNLTISPVDTVHSGMYQCRASNVHGEILSSARLQVVEIPAGFGPGSTAPSTTHALIAGAAELTCKPTGSPKPSVRWRNVNQNKEIISQGRFLIRNGNLRIQRVLSTDQGKYKCIVWNKHGSTFRTAELFVRAKVAITKPPRAMIAKEGMNVTMSCGIETASALEVIFIWKKNYVKLNEDSRVFTKLRGTLTSVLHLNNLKMTDQGSYKCIAVTTVGTRDSAMADLTVTGSSGPEPPIHEGHTLRPSVNNQFTESPTPSDNAWHKGVPGRPTEVTASDFKANKVQISWTLGRDNFSPVKRVHIEARTMFKTRLWTRMLTTADSRSRGSVILALSAWASYRFRVISENSVGNSTPSAETFPWVNSLPAAPSNYPTEIKGIGTGPTEIKITWKPLPKIQQNGPNIYYNVFHRKSGSSSNMLLNQVKYGSSFSVRGTEYYVQYEFQIQAGNDVGVGPKSPICTGFTGERRPLGIPKDLRIQIKSSRSAVAWWRGVKTDRTVMRGEFLGYKLFIWKGKWPQRSNNANFKTTRANKTTVQLDPYSSYLFQVVAYNNDGDGPGSNIAGPYNTSEDVPGVPLLVSIKNAEMGRANVTWSEPAQPNGVIIGYEIRYKEVRGTVISKKEIRSAKQWTVIDNLTPASIYEFSVAAKTKAGTGGYTTVKFDFMWLPNIQPKGLKITAVGESTIVLRWNTINDVSIIGYKVYYWSEHDSTVTRIPIADVQADREIPVSNLKSGTVYYFQLAVLNHYGAGPKTKRIRAKTIYVPTTQGVPKSTMKLPIATSAKEDNTVDDNTINSNEPIKKKRSSAKATEPRHKSIQYFFWTLITLILIFR